MIFFFENRNVISKEMGLQLSSQNMGLYQHLNIQIRQISSGSLELIPVHYYATFSPTKAFLKQNLTFINPILHLSLFTIV